MTNLGLIHVIYAPYGPLPVQRFIDSYRRHPAGIEHELVLVCKAFSDYRLPADYQDALGDVSHRVLFVPDGGFDLGSYFFAARACEHRLLCFLNSSSVILADNWLAKLSAALEEPGVGLAGATGSHESHFGAVWRSLRQPPARGSLRQTARLLRHHRSLWRAGRDFSRFPNAHLRTNAFLVERQRLLERCAVPSFRSKEDCHRFESGRHGLTAAFGRAGLQPRVVDRHGRAWPPERWQESHTFRSGSQENLLVADNRTRDYQEADEPGRQLLARMAWGD